MTYKADQERQNMRTDVISRYYRTFTYQSIDRLPDIEFGYWPQTIRRWLRDRKSVV